MRVEIRRLEKANEDDFFALHSGTFGCGWCYCVAWWVPTWEGWGERTADQNLALRRQLLRQGEHDGYLLYVDGRPRGWCQVGPRDRLEKLLDQFSLRPDEDTWAVTCFLIAPELRGRGLASRLLGEVLLDLTKHGVRRLEAYPKKGERWSAKESWTGPRAMYLNSGFEQVADGEARDVYAIDLTKRAYEGRSTKDE